MTTAPRYYALAGTFTTALTSPDGDTIRFRPDHVRNLAALQWPTTPPPKATKPGASASGLAPAETIRLEAIDAPELHYEGARQRRAATARTRLLHRLGFRDLELHGDWITGGTIAEARGWVVASSVDIHGRIIGFVYRAGDLPLTKDAPLTLDRKTLLASANAEMLRSGAAYHLAYASLNRTLRRELHALASAARNKRRGVWSHDSTRAFAFRGLGSVCERGALVFPKVFRRCVAFCQEARSRVAAADFVRWLRASREHDDEVLAGGRRVRMSALLAERGDRVRMDVDPMGIVFVPRG